MDLIEVVTIVSALGVVGALIFNSIAQLTSNKNRHYLALKDLEDEFSKIIESSSEINNWEDEPAAKIRMQSEADFVKVSMYRWKYIKFHEKVAHLAIRKIISKDIAQYFRRTFPYALQYVELSLDPEDIKSTCNFLYQWCKQEKISPER